MQTTFEVSQNWGDGLVGFVTVKNSQAARLENWLVTFETNFEIETYWDGDIVARDGNLYTVRSKSWNSKLNPGETTRFGFVGRQATADAHQVTFISSDILSDRPSLLVAVMAHESVAVESVEFTVANQWGNGFVGELSLTYGGTQPIEAWELQFDAPFELVDLWHGELVDQGAGRYTVRNSAWNGTLLPGDTITIGFKASGPSVNAPTNYSFNGEAVAATPGESVVLDLLPEKPPLPEIVPPGPPVTELPPEPPVEAPSADPAPPGTPSPSYGEVLQKSLLFYEAQRSGDLPADNRIAWRGDSALGDGADVGLDLTGGYYDAGDHVKFGFPMAASITMLSWGVIEYYDAYQASGQLDEVLDAIAWGTDYFLKAHISDGQTTQALYAQVGDPNLDHAYWGPPEAMTMARPAYKIDADNPGSDLAAETAAALAAASIVFRPTDVAYADRLLDNAKQLYAFADDHRGRYSDSIPEVQDFYRSWSGYTDELAWGAAWLYKATGEQPYLSQSQQNYQGLNPGWTQNWDDKSYGTGILLAQATDGQQYRGDVEGWLDNWLTGNIPITEGGLAWLDQWGSLRYSANTALLAGIYSDTVNPAQGQYDTFSRQQIDYILGDNPTQQSYVAGVGTNSPQYLHHRAASGTTDINDPAPNQHVLYGALVGGPSLASDTAYMDERTDFIGNEVALDYNAGFTGAVARLYGQAGGELLSDAALVGLSEAA